MDSNFPATREDLYHVQMDVKQVQVIQTDHAERLLRLERRQASDAALKSVWSSPFPSVLNGTPQQGPVATPTADVFDDFDGQGQSLITSLQLESDEEPLRRGASRANSVRFDVSALQGSNWTQNSRYSGEFGPIRPNSGFGSHPMTERSLSHKSDGRHSSAGHSVHSMHSGRTSSLGLDTNFIIGGQGDDSPVDIPEPPPGLFILGSVPSIIRCWLNTNFSHNALLYAVVCTGSQKSLLDYTLVKELGMADQLQKTPSGACIIRLPVYLPEAVVTQPTSRSNSPAPNLPTLTANFEVTGINQRSVPERKHGLRIFIGSDTLRAHSADLLFSQNIMTLYGDDRNKLSIPFVRPEDDSLFKDLCTTNLVPEKIELKATAPEFTPSESKSKVSIREGITISTSNGNELSTDPKSTVSTPSSQGGFKIAKNGETTQAQLTSRPEDSRKPRASYFDDAEPHREDEHASDEVSHEEDLAIRRGSSEAYTAGDSKRRDSSRRDSSSGIWSSWRKESVPLAPSGTESSREISGTSGYQRANRGGRSMKVLKPSKSMTSSNRSASGARTGASYEPAPRNSGESRRKNQVATTDSNGQPLKWESKRTLSEDIKVPKDLRALPNVPRSSNPIGGASAFAWMKPDNKSKSPATAAE